MTGSKLKKSLGYGKVRYCSRWACRFTLEVDRGLRPAFHVSRTVLAEDVGQRLENFFWRMWGSSRVLDRMTGSLAAKMFSGISEGGYIRTTPTQSPRSSRSLTFVQQAEQPHAEPGLSLITTTMSPKSTEIDAEEMETVVTSATKKKMMAPPHPILKKSGLAPSPSLYLNPSKESILLAHGAKVEINDSRSNVIADNRYERTIGRARGDQAPGIATEKPIKVARFQENEPSMIASENMENSNNQSSSTGITARPKTKRRTAIVASTNTSKRRPIVRQRSSQSSSSGASSTMSASQPDSASTPRVKTLMKDVVSATQTESESSKSSRSKQRTKALDAEAPREEMLLSSKKVVRQDNLVDPNFRSKFVDRTRSNHHSFTSLPSILRKSSVAAATSASYQAAGTLEFPSQLKSNDKLKGKDLPIDETVPFNTSRQKDDTTLPMPTTKSQLTLLLEKDRKAGDGSKILKGGRHKRSSP